MSVFNDVKAMHEKFGLYRKPDYNWLIFRANCINEELEELYEASYLEDAEGIVDALIDIMVFAAGTLDQFGVDGQKAWDEVHRANMSKQRGTKPTRPESGGVDLIKPEGWQGPNHSGNHGHLTDVLLKVDADGRVNI